MLKFFSFGKINAGVLVTLLVLIALGCSYFFVYVPNNEKVVQERRFRSLRKIDTNIRAKMKNSFAQIKNLLKNYDQNSLSQQKVTDYINKYPKDNFTLLLPDQAKQYFNKGKKNPPIPIEEDPSENIKFYIDVGSQFTLLARSIKSINTVSNKNSQPKKIDTNWNAIGIQFEFETFFKPLLSPDDFDNYIVFINDQKRYESFPSGLNYAIADSLLAVQNKIITPGARNIKIGETNYKAFSHPIYTHTGSQWIITGLVSGSNYEKEKNQLPLWVLLLLLTAAITMLIFLPWIKLYHMGNKDRLTRVEAIESVLVSMILMSMMFFIIFKYHPGANSFNDYSRNVLAVKITDAFQKEINTAYNLLDLFDKKHDEKDADVRLLGKGKEKYDTLLTNHSRGINVVQIFWLDESGIEKTNLTVESDNDPKGDYHGRNYFKNAKAKKYNKRGDHQFYIDQLISRTENTFRSVISKKTDTDKRVAVLAFNVKSLDSVIMPDGYQFAMIDNNGRVLYHSKPNRNLNENLKNEFADSSQLVSCIEARSDTSFKAEYYGRRYNVKIKPVPDLPYFTIILEDLAYNDMRDTEAYTFTLSMLICMLIFVSIRYGLVFFASSKRSSFKKHHFDTTWIGPHVKSHHQYNLATITNLSMILLLVIFFNWSFFLEYLYILLVSIGYSSLFLTDIFADKYKDTDPYKYKFKIRTIVWLSVFVLIINVVACFHLTPSHILHLLLFELILIVIYYIICHFGKYLKDGVVKFKSLPWTFTHSYALMVTTRLIISSGIPVAFFFIYSFNYEQNLDTRYRQINFAKDLSQKIDLSLNDTAFINKKLDSIKNNLIYTSGVYCDSFFINSIRITDKENADQVNRNSPFNYEDALTAHVLAAFRLRLNSVEIKDNNLNLLSTDGSVFFNKLNRQIHDASPIQTLYKIGVDKYIAISSLPHINYASPGVLSLSLLAVLIIVFYFVTHNITLKLFALNLLPRDGWKQMDSGLLKNFQLNKLVLIVGSPGSNTYRKLKNYISSGYIKESKDKPYKFVGGDGNGTDTVFVADMMLIATSWEGQGEWKKCREQALNGYPLVIINHFEYNISNANSNSAKLDLLEELLSLRKSKIIIISTVNPLTFLDSFNKQQQSSMSESERQRWNNVLGNFYLLVDPLIRYSDFQKDFNMPEKAMIKETRYSRFLHGMQKISLDALNKELTKKTILKSSGQEAEDRTRDSMTLKLQLTSQYFYTSIWQSLTHEEKFILYDLAEDGLVNSYDDFDLSMLISKGLIVSDDGMLMPFNNGFRNFILTAIGENEMNHIKEQIKDNGKWGDLKTPLNLAILAILAFLFASQQEAYSRVITYVGVLGAGLPQVLRIFSLFRGGAETKKIA